MSWVSSPSRSHGNPAWAAFRRLAARAASRDSALRHADWLLLAVVLALTLLGTLLIWSATQPMLIGQGSSPDEFLLKQVLDIALGLVLMLIVSSLSTRQIRLYAPIVYGLSCLGLLAVLTPLGSCRVCVPVRGRGRGPSPARSGSPRSRSCLWPPSPT